MDEKHPSTVKRFWRSTAEQFPALLETLRPRQWTKNLLVFSGLIFSENAVRLDLVTKTMFAFLIFCLQAGSVYLINDIVDVEKDRAHPEKRFRPLASGRLSLSLAKVIFPILQLGCLFAAFILDVNFGYAILGYALIFLLYSFCLKNVVVLDVMTIALGFLLRPVAGAVAINVAISKWLLVCTIFLSLFLALYERRHELLVLGDESSNHRKILVEYRASFLDQMVAVATATPKIFSSKTSR